MNISKWGKNENYCVQCQSELIKYRDNFYLCLNESCPNYGLYQVGTEFELPHNYENFVKAVNKAKTD